MPSLNFGLLLQPTNSGQFVIRSLFFFFFFYSSFALLINLSFSPFQTYPSPTTYQLTNQPAHPTPGAKKRECHQERIALLTSPPLVAPCTRPLLQNPQSETPTPGCPSASQGGRLNSSNNIPNLATVTLPRPRDSSPHGKSDFVPHPSCQSRRRVQLGSTLHHDSFIMLSVVKVGRLLRLRSRPWGVDIITG